MSFNGGYKYYKKMIKCGAERSEICGANIALAIEWNEYERSELN